MDYKLQINKTFKAILFLFIAIGLAAFIYGFATHQAERTWANYLLNNFYFISISLGALFWMALQYITQSGWSSPFLRIPQAMGTYLVYALILWVGLFFGLHSLYHWSHSAAMASDPILAHKAPYLNIGFLIVRTAVIFGLLIFLALRMRKLSLKEDVEGGNHSFTKIEFTSKVFIFVLGLSFIFFPIDWLESLDAHWFSTIFSVKYFVSAFYHGTSIILAFVLITNHYGYFPFLNEGHRHDFSKYLFMLSIMWGYMWFMQYLLIWYGNIPEETVYYFTRREEGFTTLFYLEIFINWFFPFIFLMWNRLAKNATALLITVGVLIIGQWIELYNAIFPGTVEHPSIGFIEIGSFIGFAGLFLVVVLTALSKYPLIPRNHPYLEESIELKDIEEFY